MSRSVANQHKADLDALKALQADVSELECIKNLHEQFNVFEAIGFNRDELMHSNFLAFLLDPKRNDGLRDLLLKEMLRETLASIDWTTPPSAFGGLDRVLANLHSMDLGKTFVRREHQDIDLLLTNETHQLAVIIENKIWSPEQPGQLVKYDKIVEHNYPGWDVLKIYLTPFGVASSHEEYVPLSYGAVCGIVDGILEDRGSTLDPDVKMSVEHYVGMVRRRILGNPEVVRLSQQLYRKHKRAFDLVYEHRPDVRAQIRPIIEELISQQPSRLELEPSSIDTIRFGVKDWDTDALLTAEDWTESGRILIFVVYNRPDSLDLHLFMGPGPDSIRQRILGMVSDNPEVLLKPSSVRAKWLSIYSRPLLRQEAYEDLDQEEREEEIRRQWDLFIQWDLPRIAEALRGEALIGQSVEPGPV